MLKILNKMRNKKGFTLVELIVVIAIIGLLVAIATPRIIGFREKAVTARNEANEEMLYKAASMYLAENGNPSADFTDTATSHTHLDDYVEEWPAGCSVKIEDDGKITVTTP